MGEASGDVTIPTGKPTAFGPGGRRWSPGGVLALPGPEGCLGSSSSSSGPCPREEPTRENRRLNPDEVEALCVDDFLLGRTSTDLVGVREPFSAGLSIDRAFAELDVALKCRDLKGAEACWRRLSSLRKEGSLAVLAQRPEFRAVALRYVAAITPQILDELETALDRGDRLAARAEHQRLTDLRAIGGITDSTAITPVGAAGGLIDSPAERGRRAQLEARYQQLVNRSGPLVCNFVPDLWWLCWSSCSAERAVQGPTPVQRTVH
mmetsp:Transcript_85204/g.237872  ORF Transcript_85204/g.237872 Transcript_85204/m.237872 type:complete len:264 (-) Transcript_85204:160-951(-)